MKNRSRFPAAAAILAVVSVCACTPIVEVHGDHPDPRRLAKIEIGKTTESQVQALLGTPSSTMTYGEDVWHYISSRTKTVAFFKPDVEERTIVTIKFDKNGKVASVTTTGLKNGHPLQMVSRETPTAGSKMSLLQQLIGNVGRFSKEPGGQ
jgi:outer membrane protein assembly factor BamE (lipoprotein component of BamABCDE complex)